MISEDISLREHNVIPHTVFLIAPEAREQVSKLYLTISRPNQDMHLKLL
jgi:hypothetical protein